jgi:phospholipid/cholesterol/gamma-HCH transport system permease protein
VNSIIQRFRDYLHDIGQFTLFSIEALRFIPYNLRHPKELFINLMGIGLKTMPMIAVTSIFYGLIMGLQLSDALEAIIAGTSQFIGSALAVALVKELGPILAALLMVARVCSSVTAQLGTMRVTEQIDALSTFAVNPMRHLVTPRILAGMISLPILGFLSVVVAFAGGAVMVISVYGVTPAVFWELAQYPLKIRFVIQSLIKMVIIGGYIMLIATYQGFKTKGGAAGVGESTINSVVTSSFMVILLDFILTAMFIMFWK